MRSGDPVVFFVFLLFFLFLFSSIFFVVFCCFFSLFFFVFVSSFLFLCVCFFFLVGQPPPLGGGAGPRRFFWGGARRGTTKVGFPVVQTAATNFGLLGQTAATNLLGPFLSKAQGFCWPCRGTTNFRAGPLIYWSRSGFSFFLTFGLTGQR